MQYFLAHSRASAEHDALSVLVAAKTLAQAQKLIRQGFADPERFEYQELSPLAFSELQGSKAFTVLGDTSFLALDTQSQGEQLKTLARSLSEQLQRQGHAVALGQLQTALAASLGRTSWQVLAHGSQPAKAHVRRSTDVASKGSSSAQPAGTASSQGLAVEGPNLMWEVPVSVNATASALVLVLASSREQAVQQALGLAAQGGVAFALDEENASRPRDYYLPDEDAVRCLGLEKERAAAQGWQFAQSGRYGVSLYLLERDDDLLWADLDILMPGVQDDEEQAYGCLSSMPAQSTREEQETFCLRIAALLNHNAPEPELVGRAALEAAFSHAAQGDVAPASYQAIALKLRQSVGQAENRPGRS